MSSMQLRRGGAAVVAVHASPFDFPQSELGEREADVLPASADCIHQKNSGRVRFSDSQVTGCPIAVPTSLLMLANPAT